MIKKQSHCESRFLGMKPALSADRLQSFRWIGTPS